MKTASEYPYPASEEALEGWVADQASSAAVIAKLAFKRLRGLQAKPLWESVVQNDFPAAQQQVWQVAEQQRRFLEQTRFVTNGGCRFTRFYALGKSQDSLLRPPQADGSYWQALSMLFTHLNGPLAGEETFAVPPEMDAEVGLSSLPEEMHVALSRDNQCLGAAAIRYNRARTQAETRTLYEGSHEIAVKAANIARTLLARDDLTRYQLPYVLPPTEVEQAVGLSALESPYYINSPQSFSDLLPEALK